MQWTILPQFSVRSLSPSCRLQQDHICDWLVYQVLGKSVHQLFRLDRVNPLSVNVSYAPSEKPVLLQNFVACRTRCPPGPRLLVEATDMGCQTPRWPARARRRPHSKLQSAPKDWYRKRCQRGAGIELGFVAHYRFRW